MANINIMTNWWEANPCGKWRGKMFPPSPVTRLLKPARDASYGALYTQWVKTVLGSDDVRDHLGLGRWGYVALSGRRCRMEFQPSTCCMSGTCAECKTHCSPTVSLDIWFDEDNPSYDCYVTYSLSEERFTLVEGELFTFLGLDTSMSMSMSTCVAAATRVVAHMEGILDGDAQSGVDRSDIDLDRAVLDHFLACMRGENLVPEEFAQL